MNAGDGLDHSAHEMVQFRFLRGQSKAAGKITALDISRAGCSLFTDLLEEIQWDTAPEKERFRRADCFSRIPFFKLKTEGLHR